MDGSNPDLWPVFEDEFNTLIDSYKDSDVTDVEKFTLIREHMIGQAADRIGELALTADNFKDAFELLKDVYGDKNQRVVRLYMRIQNCRLVTGTSDGFNYNEMVRVICLFGGVIRSLRNMNFDIEANAGWIFANIRRVFPKQLLAMWDLATEVKRDQTALIGTTATVAEFLEYARARTRTLYGTRDHNPIGPAASRRMIRKIRQPIAQFKRVKRPVKITISKGQVVQDVICAEA